MRHGTWGRGVTAAMVAAVLAACAPGSDGPLGASDTSDVDGYVVCMPIPDGTIGYVGIPLRNQGTEEVELSGFTVETGEGGAEVELLLDLDAAGHDQMIGSAIWPSDAGPVWIPEVLARTVDPVGAVVPAGATADLLVAVGSLAPGANAAAGETTVDRVELAYRSGSREHVLVRTGVARLLIEGAC